MQFFVNMLTMSLILFIGFPTQNSQPLEAFRAYYKRKTQNVMNPENSLSFLQGVLADISDAELASGSGEMKRRMLQAPSGVDLGTNRGFSGFKLGSIGSALHEAHSSLGPGKK